MRITDQNRAHPTMYGGWGPHLRGVMRAPDGTLWFMADAGPDVLTNASVLYFRLGEDGWEHVDTQAHLPGVQQNAGSVMSTRNILTYAVNTAQSNLEECYFDTEDWDYKACNTITIGGPIHTTPPNSNYIGAAIESGGTRVIWYTVVGGAGSGQFNYTYNAGAGWQGPVLYTLPGYNTFEYVRTAFLSATRVSWLGQILIGKYPGGTFDPGVTETDLGQAPSLTVLDSGDGTIDARTGADLWIDPATGDAHVLVQSAGRLGYYFRPGGADWADHAVAVQHLDDTFRARFMAPPGLPLAMVRGSASGDSGVEVLLAQTVPGEPVDWSEATSIPVPQPVDGLDAPSGIYVEGASYQTQSVADYNFALCGRFEISDHEIWHGTLVEVPG